MNRYFMGTLRTVGWYFCSLMRSRWTLSGAWDRGLTMIASRGLCSLCTTISFPYIQTGWIFRRLHTQSQVTPSLFERNVARRCWVILRHIWWDVHPGVDMHRCHFVRCQLVGWCPSWHQRITGLDYWWGLSSLFPVCPVVHHLFIYLLSSIISIKVIYIVQ